MLSFSIGTITFLTPRMCRIHDYAVAPGDTAYNANKSNLVGILEQRVVKV